MQYEAMLAIAAGLVILLMLLPPWLEVLPLRLKARRDYRQTRGTVHLKQITAGLEILEAKLSELDSMAGKAEQKLRAIRSDQERELTSVLSRQIILTHLPEAEGVGSKLTELILTHCFEGTLSSLHQAHVVDGVGEKKQESIDRWIAHWEIEFQEMMEKDFPGKWEITERYKYSIADTHDEIEAMKPKREYLTKLRTSATNERNALSLMTRSVFIRVSLTPGLKPELLLRYFHGVHPEWEPPPDWFEDLLAIIEGKDIPDTIIKGGGG